MQVNTPRRNVSEYIPTCPAFRVTALHVWKHSSKSTSDSDSCTSPLHDCPVGQRVFFKSLSSSPSSLSFSILQLADDSMIVNTTNVSKNDRPRSPGPNVPPTKYAKHSPSPPQIYFATTLPCTALVPASGVRSVRWRLFSLLHYRLLRPKIFACSEVGWWRLRSSSLSGVPS